MTRPRVPKSDQAASPLPLGWRSGEAGTEVAGQQGQACEPEVPLSLATHGARGDDEGSPPAVVATGAKQQRAPRNRPEPTPAQRALGLLVRREHSQRELTRKLTARGVSTDDAKAAVEKLKSAGWQDDGRFAENLVHSRAAAGFGPVRVRAELAMHGLDRELITATLDAFDGDWSELARDLVRRRFGSAGPDDRARQRKAAELLLRRGFSGDQVRAATRYDPDD